MRILILSKRDLTATVLLNDLLARLAALPGCRLRVVLAERTRPVELEVPELARMKHLERDLPFGTLFPRLDATPEQAGELMTPARLAARHGIDIGVARGLDDPAFTAAVEEFLPDLIVSARFSFLIPRRLFDVARHGVVNVHPGRLPGYAGLYPHFFSMLAGEDALGCSLHHIDAGIDSGPLITEGAVPIRPGRSAFAHNLDSHLLGNRLINELVENLLAGRAVTAVPQGQSKVKSNTYPTPAEFEAFRAAGLSLIGVHEYRELLGRFGISEDLPEISGTV
ncbi:hypothetical protein MWN33_15510 [Starkeya koreensis]|uniref:Formyl transferase N-terminal domain-containing protein n=1 Tax=Ancylobacter koreensis TaxID=266121 RepID=A0ABT0DQ87_9HYPH|nr:formyltransferase family protein [Ancylobacter koreensis]MCK0209441.1 hypothetical protein [Ancylobacter koreensis]